MRRTTLAITALLLALTSCSSATSTMSSMSTTSRLPSGGSGSGGGIGGVGTSVNLVSGALVRFNACDDFLTHVKAEAVERVGPYGLDWYNGSPWAWRSDGRLLEVMTDAAFAVPEAAAQVGG